MQLDLFVHSRPVVLRNDLVQALWERRPVMGRKAHAKLAGECPQDALLAPASRLLDALETTPGPFAAHLDAQRAAAHAESVLAG
ncbi:MAG: hypothetical protein LBS49_01535, partial [Candidatus Accumulibacter sp.]|nr:hypothetical protein [Accumulibacter sp.]